jgi:hypothetical protein
MSSNSKVVKFIAKLIIDAFKYKFMETFKIGEFSGKALSGGKITVSLFEKFISIAEDGVDSFTHGGKKYTRDPQWIAHKRVFNVYTTGRGKSTKVFIQHAPTDKKSMEDVLADVGLALGLKTKRVSEAVKYQIEAEEKYINKGITDITTIGYSLGAFVAEESVRQGSRAKEVFLISRPITFLNVRSILPANITSIKSALDPVGLLSLIFKQKSVETVLEPDKVRTAGAFIREHLAPVILDRLKKTGVKEVGIEEEPKEGGKILATEKYSKRRVADLKEEIKVLRREKKVPVRDFPMTGKSKKQLFEMVQHLREL